jgi:hypothetical protein
LPLAKQPGAVRQWIDGEALNSWVKTVCSLAQGDELKMAVKGSTQTRLARRLCVPFDAQDVRTRIDSLLGRK